jgi:hypothetical protein
MKNDLCPGKKDWDSTLPYELISRFDCILLLYATTYKYYSINQIINKESIE